MSGAGNQRNGEFNPGESIHLESLEQQIAQLWHPDASGDRPLTSLATRATVLNLVSFVPDNETAQRTISSAERISQIHPSRVIIFSGIGDQDAVELKPDLYATCEADSELSAAPCIEQIRVPVDRPRYQQMATIARPLLVADLPTIVWWRGSLDPDDTAFLNLIRSADLTVFDSLRFGSIQHLTDLQRVRELLPPGSTITDLNWHRLQPWRELSAQFFDIRAMHWALQNIREIEIDAGSDEDKALPGQVLMYISWLSHCLGWKSFEARRTRNDRWYIGVHDRRGEHVRIIVRTRPAGEEWRGQLLAVSMTAEESSYGSCSLSLSRTRGSSIIRMHARSGLDSTLHHAVYHPLLPDEALLIPVFEATEEDHMFNAALDRTVELISLFGKPEAL